METRQPATLGVSIVVFVIASLFVALRFVSRIFLVRRVGLHDYLMLFAWVGLMNHVPAGIPGSPQHQTRPAGVSCDNVTACKTFPMGTNALRQVINFGFSFSLFYATKNGLGRHARDIPSENEPALNRANYAFTVLYVR